ncbi:MAG: hypothetical protein M3373_01660 [Gemmatimonadota bacterium]|nr:hypothetical protein [Gemmatimonadota bacterium]
MSASQYAFIFTLVPFLFGIAAVFAHRAGGNRALWTTWLAAALLFSVLGYLDWRSPPDHGTPYAAYLSFATIPTAAASLVTARTAESKLPLIARVLLAGTVCWATIFPVLLVLTMLTA